MLSLLPQLLHCISRQARPSTVHCPCSQKAASTIERKNQSLLPRPLRSDRYIEPSLSCSGYFEEGARGVRQWWLPYLVHGNMEGMTRAQSGS